MIIVRSLLEFAPADLQRVASGYTSNGRFVVTYSESENRITFDLQFNSTAGPYIGKYDHYNTETLHRYSQLLGNGFSLGAYEENVLVGFIIAEPRKWNRSLWVHEFHVAEAHRNMGIGKQLMEGVVENAKRMNLRTIVCETQNTNVTAIQVYRKLGFRVEGIDISYYTNKDYPDGEVAVFMKRRL